MRTYCIETLGCRVNQYESEQIATLLRSRGLVPARSAEADLRIVNTCSVTVQAASKSRQTARRATRLPVLQATPAATPPSLPPTVERRSHPRARVVVTGCWATSNPEDAGAIPGVDAVLGHGDQVAEQLQRLLDRWLVDEAGQARPGRLQPAGTTDITDNQHNATPTAAPVGAHARATPPAQSSNKPPVVQGVKENPATPPAPLSLRGTVGLPLLDTRQAAHQRAYLKIQDGCDAHCTYCIIPKLRPAPWSKPPEQVIEEARRLVAAGHRELVLTGIFLGAYGQPTALRRRQPQSTSRPLARLAHLLCRDVPDLHRLRFSSLEPGDLDPHLIDAFRVLPRLVPHFHLPLQSGSDALLRRMNRQYTRDDYLRMLDQVHTTFDRPALTTDIIVGFPGETDAEFEQTLDLVDRAGFIHIHAFHFSPRPGTAAARWTRDFVRGPVVQQRIAELQRRAAANSLAFRRQFIGQTVELLVERPTASVDHPAPLRHGRSERYFPVHFASSAVETGQLVRVRVDAIDGDATYGTLLP